MSENIIVNTYGWEIIRDMVGNIYTSLIQDLT